MSPTLRRLSLAILLAVLVPSAVASGAGKDVIRDCTDDEVMQKTYTQKEYRAALRELAADADQYGNCRDVILRAQQQALAAGKGAGRSAGNGTQRTDGAGAAGGGGSPDGGAGAIGSAPAAEQLGSATERERAAVEQARATRSGPVSLDAASVDPAKVGTAPGVGQVADLPAPLVILLALLLAGALALGGLRIRRLVDARRA
ncbi:MAG TPA: hypothetical protein VNT54_09585 [Solirubrobacteraceae bacterium]|nr:hypothetical protein [Solirubrobacteraceae bacterium]